MAKTSCKALKIHGLLLPWLRLDLANKTGTFYINEGKDASDFIIY